MSAFAVDQRIPPVAGRLWLLVALVLVLVPHVTRLPPLLVVGCAALIGWRLLRDIKGWELPSRATGLLLTIAGFGAVLVLYHGHFGREPSVALLTVMVCLKLLELRTMRDALLVVALGYFLVVAGFLYSQSIFMGAYLFAVVVALTTALVALNHPAATLGRSRFYARLAGGLLVQALPLMVVLFVLFPRVPGPLWSLPSSSVARTGLSDNMKFGSVGELADSDEVAFRVTFDGTVPAAKLLYWRGPVLWFTDGRNWKAIAPDDPRGSRLGGASYRPHGDAVRYTITLQPQHRRWLFALDLPADAPPLAGEIRGDFQLLSRRPIDDVVRYSMRSYPRYSMDTLNRAQRFLGLALPEDVNPRARELGESWRAAGLSDKETVERALRFFVDNPFYYTRRPPLLDGPNPIDAFLFETRKGFCEHYAAAFVSLMRAAGVPARVVTGYQGGELNPLGHYLIVRQSDAHAWAEVWLDGQGWVRVDPTAAIPPSRIEATQDLSRFTSIAPPIFDWGGADWLGQVGRGFRDGWDAVNFTWNRWILGFDQERQFRLLQGLGFKSPGWREMVMALALSSGVLLIGVAVFLMRPRRRKRDPVAMVYERFCAKLGRRGLHRRTSEGPTDFARRISEARPDLITEVDEITGLYISIRYGTADPGAVLPCLKRAVARFTP